MAKIRDIGLVGDGVTDNTLALQNLFDNLSATGGTVEFSPGTYLVDFADTLIHQSVPLRYCIKVPSNIEIVLHPAAIIKAANGSNGSGFHFGNDYVTEGASARVRDSDFGCFRVKNTSGAAPAAAGSSYKPTFRPRRRA